VTEFLPLVLGEKIFLERGRQKGVPLLPLKRRYFAAIGSYSVKTVADRFNHAAYKHCWQGL